MTLYNVRGAVVALIEADSETAAITELQRLLEAKGFQPYNDVGTFDAFESEPL